MLKKFLMFYAVLMAAPAFVGATEVALMTSGSASSSLGMGIPTSFTLPAGDKTTAESTASGVMVEKTVATEKRVNASSDGKNKASSSKKIVKKKMIINSQ